MVEVLRNMIWSFIFASVFFFFSGKTYKPIDFVACISMSVGLILFTLADSTVQPEFNQTGKFCSQ